MALTRTSLDVSADVSRGAIIENKTTAAALEVGDACYITTSDTVEQADQDAGTELVANGVGIIVAAPNQYGEIAIASGDQCSLCIFGKVFGFTGMTVGGRIWIGATAGELTQTKPSDGWRVSIGYALAADVIFVNPDADTASSN